MNHQINSDDTIAAIVARTIINVIKDEKRKILSIITRNFDTISTVTPRNINRLSKKAILCQSGRQHRNIGVKRRKRDDIIGDFSFFSVCFVDLRQVIMILLFNSAFLRYY